MNTSPSFFKEFFGYIIGSGSGALFAANMFFALVLASISFYFEINKRDVLNTDTPIAFNKRFMWLDNVPRLFFTIVTIYVFVRFAREALFNWVFANSKFDTKELQFVASAIIGLLFDRLALFLKQIGILANNKIRDKFKQAGLSDADQQKINEISDKISGIKQ